MSIVERDGAAAPYALTCPQCGKTKKLAWTALRTFHRALRVTCPCGTQFDVPLERRTFPRKQVMLVGHLFTASSWTTHTRTYLGEIRIHCLSLGGMSFYVQSLPDAEAVHTFTVGDHYLVALTLDDAAHTPLEMHMRVCHVHGWAIGATFMDSTPYNHALDFYLTS